MEVPMRDIAFVGQMGSGKSTASEMLREYVPLDEYEVVKVPMAKCLRDAYELFWPAEAFNRWRMQELGRMLRHIDENVLLHYAKREMARIEDESSALSLPVPVFTVDDVRYPNEWWGLKEWDFAIVRIRAPRDVRIQRLRLNGKLNDEAELEHETELALPEDEYVADYTIDNDGSLDDLHEDIANVVWREAQR